MAYSIVTHTGDGSTTTFAINFTLGYISRDDVRCHVGSEVDGLGDPVYRALTWISEGLVEVQGDPPGDGVTIEFTRTVAKDQLIHDYSDGAAITELHLDQSNKQVIMMVQEFLDDRVRVTPTSATDMNSQRITNVADGVDAQDACTVSQAAQAIELTPSILQAASDAEAAVTAAQVAASSAESTLANAMLKSQNLDDVQSKATSRTNLDVYSKSESDTLINARVLKSGDTMTGALTLNATATAGANSLVAASTEYADRAATNSETAATGSSLVFITTATANNSAFVAFTNIPTSYDELIVEFDHVNASAAADLNFSLSNDNGASYITTNGYFYAGSFVRSSAAAINYLIGNATTLFKIAPFAVQAGGGISGNAHFFGFQGTGKLKQYTSQTQGWDNTGYTTTVIGGTNNSIATAINAMKFYGSTGNIAEGTFRLYGVKKS